MKTAPIHAADAAIREALAAADVPVLCMVLVHLTGERRWIEAPFLPVRDISFFADESGGLPTDVQAQVREAAFAALVGLREGAALPESLPADELFAEMMSVCVAERVGDDYVPMMLEEMGLRDRNAPWHRAVQPVPPPGFRVLVVGAGMSGICLAGKLEAVGIPYTVVDKNAALGGTWLENTYPEVGCDVPNHFYSFSDRPNPDWSSYF